MELIVDTNVLLYTAKYKLDLQKLIRSKFGLISIIVPNVVVYELKNLANASEKKSERDAAHLALLIIKHNKLPSIKLSGPADTAIAEWAVKSKASVLTNDLKLRYRLKELGAKVFCLRQKEMIQEW